MGCNQLTASQIGALCGIRSQVPQGGRVWIHGELDSIYVEVEDADGHNILEKRFFEDGTSGKTRTE